MFHKINISLITILLISVVSFAQQKESGGVDEKIKETKRSKKKKDRKLEQERFKSEPYGTDLIVGVKAGLNFNKLRGQRWETEMRTNIATGLFLALNGRKSGIQLEGLWSMNTYVSDNNVGGLYDQYFKASSDSIATGKFTFHSFSVPVLINYKFTQCLWMQVGPQFNCLLSDLNQQGFLKNSKFLFTQGSVSAVAGLWFNIGRVGPIPRFNIGARCIAGIKNLSTMNEDETWRNQRIQIHIGLGY